MAKVSICVEEEEVPMVQSLLHVARTMRTLYGRVHIDFRDGKPLDMTVEERLRISDFIGQIQRDTH